MTEAHIFSQFLAATLSITVPILSLSDSVLPCRRCWDDPSRWQICHRCCLIIFAWLKLMAEWCFPFEEKSCWEPAIPILVEINPTARARFGSAHFCPLLPWATCRAYALQMQIGKSCTSVEVWHWLPTFLGGTFVAVSSRPLHYCELS